jgi:hypothetical protein
MSSSPICQTTDEMLGQDCEATEEKQAPAAEMCTTLDGEGTTVDGEGTTLDGEGTTVDGEGKDTTAASESAPAVREPPKKYYDIDDIWAEKAGPDDELTRYTLALQMGPRVLVAHMIVDPLLDITTKEIEYMKHQGFVLERSSSVLRKDLHERDIVLLRKSQWINPEELVSG